MESQRDQHSLSVEWEVKGKLQTCGSAQGLEHQDETLLHHLQRCEVQGLCWFWIHIHPPHTEVLSLGLPKNVNRDIS
jgi:hypothetical protein